MPFADVSEWLDEQSGRDVVWLAKRLSGNDTLANESNQAGPYLPKEFLFNVFPDLNQPEAVNPDVWFDFYIDSHADFQRVRAVWYNGRVRGTGTRNEARLTNFGGAQSAMLDPESTGSLALFAFHLSPENVTPVCHAWVCDHELEAEVIEERIGPVEPSRLIVWIPTAAPPQWQRYTNLLSLMQAAPSRNCFLSVDQIPPEWLKSFPSGAEIITKAVGMSPCRNLTPDQRLLKRRECEFQIFQSVEQATYLPSIQQGFSSVEAFIRLAQRVLQSRKTRSGKSLELHTKAIFTEEALAHSRDFSHNPEIEGGKRPDFIFPSKAAYEDGDFPAERLRMLAAKTTCKDRWRQILNEADRIPQKHLLTLQEGVSERQFKEMSEAGVTLVVPQKLHEKFPQPIRPHLITLESFIADVRHLRAEP
jgi:hypothetical protein